MKTLYTLVAEVKPHLLSVNVVVSILRETFVRFSEHGTEDDDAVGQVIVGDASGSIDLLVTNRHLLALGLNEASQVPFNVIIKNVLPAVVFGRLRIELNRFSSVCMRNTMGDCLVNRANNVSLIDHDALARLGG
jgi:hypothetical protein